MVMMVTGLLVALLLPAVQQAREAARKAQCQDHLHNFVVAMHNYESAFRVFPPGWVHQEPQRSNYGWGTSLLPFVEQAPLYNALQMGRPALAVALADDGRRQALQTSIDLYRCPSDVAPRINNERRLIDIHDAAQSVATSNYVAVNGGGDWTRGRELRGCYGENSATGIRNITDGTSNTLGLGERGWGLGLGTPDAALCAAAVYPGVSGDGLSVREDDALVHGLYNVNARGRIEDGGAPHCRYSLMSLHPGGAQVGLCDGKVTFLAQGIDPFVLQCLMDKADGNAIRVP